MRDEFIRPLGGVVVFVLRRTYVPLTLLLDDGDGDECVAADVVY